MGGSARFVFQFLIIATLLLSMPLIVSPSFAQEQQQPSDPMPTPPHQPDPDPIHNDDDYGELNGGEGTPKPPIVPPDMQSSEKEVAQGVGHKQPSSSEYIDIYNVEGKISDTKATITGSIIIIEKKDPNTLHPCVFSYTYVDGDGNKVVVKSVFWVKKLPCGGVAGDNILPPTQTLTVDFYKFGVMLWELTQSDTTTSLPTPLEIQSKETRQEIEDIQNDISELIEGVDDEMFPPPPR